LLGRWAATRSINLANGEDNSFDSMSRFCPELGEQSHDPVAPADFPFEASFGKGGESLGANAARPFKRTREGCSIIPRDAGGPMKGRRA
jgi:hypothetical protein